ncbi:MAG: ThiF family adenylyltransferase [Kiritimatiellae bacterium]|nr:ThiF family adenylyltransferase [Verrucomicrobiota bacterium]MBU4290051.1 ThiF family adenylyltransferase [Verrucomicrobiota bacterium]MCG2679579.1 ThiF family adenylyltransferase [Kiritimatiellia bacterium]
MNAFDANRDPIDLTPETRYARQVVLPEIGASGQRKLLGSSVLIIGCGALGCIQAELLARAGVGKLVIADRDVPTIHNLQRQFLFDEDDVAAKLPKAVAAARKLKKINSTINIEEIVMDITPDNIEGLVKASDVILDGTDNFETRFLINDAAVKYGKPWIYGGVQGTMGMVLPVCPVSGPCLLCLLSEPPPHASLPTCDTHGVLNTIVAWIASLQVTEAFKLLLGYNFPVYSMNVFDLWKGTFRSVPVKRDGNCPTCVQRHFEYLEADAGSRTLILCGRNAVQVSPALPQNLSLDVVGERLSRAGPVSINGRVIEFQTEGHRMIIFPDGRVIVGETKDPAIARSLVAKYLGN